MPHGCIKVLDHLYMDGYACWSIIWGLQLSAVFCPYLILGTPPHPPIYLYNLCIICMIFFGGIVMHWYIHGKHFAFITCISMPPAEAFCETCRDTPTTLCQQRICIVNLLIYTTDVIASRNMIICRQSWTSCTFI